MTKEEFTQNYILKSKITQQEFDESFLVLPCACGYCAGWAVVRNTPYDIRLHKGLFGPKDEHP